MKIAVSLLLAGLLFMPGCAAQTTPPASSPADEAAERQAKSDKGAELGFWLNDHPLLAPFIAVPLIPVVLISFPFWYHQRETCTYDNAGHTVTYEVGLPEPTRCNQFAEQQREQRWAAEREAQQRQKEADEEAERERKYSEEAAERERMEAEQRRKEAVEALLRESPVQSEEGLKRDLAVVARLTPAQLEAMRDAANAVVLTKNEQKALRSISLDQWHALSQLAAFKKWLDDKSREAQAEAEKQQEQAAQQQEQAEQERERTRLAVYQSLMAEAATRQASAAEWQAAAAWWQQRCLSNLSWGLRCY